jgi:bloom syndrome protein
MAVRMTPKKKPASAPAKTKRKTKTSNANQTGVAAVRNLPFSTNVSSPTQAPSKNRKGRPFINEDEDEDEDEDAFDPPPRYANGYARDSFLVDDEDDDDFVPLREAGKTKQKKSRELGPPITKDVTMDRLSSAHRELVEDFVDNAKEEGRKIRQMHNLRFAPFSDTILRQMAIRLVTSKRALLQIPDINAEMVKLHGEVFITVLKNLRAHTGFQEDEEEEQRPIDPNHQNVIDLVSDDEEEEDEYGGDSAFEEDEEGEEEDGPSSYFQMPAKPDNVMKFNQKFTQAQESAGKKVTKPVERGRKGGKSKGSGGGGAYKKKYHKNKKAGGGKRGSGGGASGGGGNGFRGNGIGMMPI